MPTNPRIAAMQRLHAELIVLLADAIAAGRVTVNDGGILDPRTGDLNVTVTVHHEEDGDA